MSERRSVTVSGAPVFDRGVMETFGCGPPLGGVAGLFLSSSPPATRAAATTRDNTPIPVSGSFIPPAFSSNRAHRAAALPCALLPQYTNASARLRSPYLSPIHGEFRREFRRFGRWSCPSG